MSTQLANLEPQDTDAAIRLAERLATSGLVPKSMRGRPDDVLLTMMTGAALGVPAVRALSTVHVVEGKPVLSADLMLGLAMRHPACEYVQLVESSATRCLYEAKRRGQPSPTKLEWTIEQARAAGLIAKDNWKKYPDAMLRARCAAAIVRAVFPDVLAGVYEHDEADEFRRQEPPPRPRQQQRSPRRDEGVVDVEVVMDAPWPAFCEQLRAKGINPDDVRRWTVQAFGEDDPNTYSSDRLQRLYRHVIIQREAFEAWVSQEGQP